MVKAGRVPVRQDWGNTAGRTQRVAERHPGSGQYARRWPACQPAAPRPPRGEDAVSKKSDTPPPAIVTPLTTTNPWLRLGLSRTTLYRLLETAPTFPQPLRFPGARRCWRLADLERWLEKQRPT